MDYNLKHVQAVLANSLEILNCSGDSAEAMRKQIEAYRQRLKLEQSELKEAKQKLKEAQERFEEKKEGVQMMSLKVQDLEASVLAHLRIPQESKHTVIAEVFKFLECVTESKQVWDNISDEDYTRAVRLLGIGIPNHSKAPNVGVATKQISHSLNGDGSFTVTCVPLYAEPDYGAFKITVVNSDAVKPEDPNDDDAHKSV